MNEGAALRVLSYLNDTEQHHLASLANEKRKVTVIGEEHEPNEFQEEEGEPSSSSIINEEETSLTPEQLKEFFKAAEDGSIERLDELFDTVANADPNMTNYTESLLMAAIRAKRRKVAEYLIDQWAINVNYTTDLIEFRLNTGNPVRERTISCRDLAYETGMMNLVDLIDIASDEVKPSIKRYLRRRLKTRLNEIHQAYLKRLKEYDHRLTIEKQQKENQILEIKEENEETSAVNMTDDTSLPPPPPPLPSLNQPIIHHSYRSHIEETMKKIESSNDKSIDATGKKAFRFSNFTLRYRLVETKSKKLRKNEEVQSQSTPFAFPVLLPTTPRPLSRLVTRPTTAATVANTNRHSPSEINARSPIRETRASISRTARRAATPGAASSAIIDNKSETKPVVTTSINTVERLLSRRSPPIRTNYFYVPQVQQTLYIVPRRSLPVTLKATAIGLSSDTRLIRD